MVICLERGADLHTAQLMPLPLTVSCFSKIPIGLPFWYRLTRVVPEKGPLNVCSVVVNYTYIYSGDRRRCDYFATSLWTFVVRAGGLSVAVEGPSKAEIRCAADCESDHSYNVTYYPLTAGTYSIAVRVATKHIPGSPFTASVLPPGNVVVPLPTTGRSGSRPK